GKEADARTDVFAFGLMLYEMITGKKAFEGKSQVSLLAAILEHQPQPMSILQTMTAPALEHLVARCLAKDPDHRWQSATDVNHELAWISETGAPGHRNVSMPAARKPWLWIAATAICFLVVLGLLVARSSAKTSPQRVLRYSIPLPKHGQTEGLHFSYAISPD